MCHLPRLPQQRDLISQLSPIHAKLSRESSISRKHPIHRCNEVQVFLVLIHTEKLSQIQKYDIYFIYMWYASETSIFSTSSFWCFFHQWQLLICTCLLQAETATKFLNVMWHYLESLCSNLKSHTITSVQSNHDRVT
jgi:hypothetical protein